MQTTEFNQDKDTLLKNNVAKILFKKGYSFLFDEYYFKLYRSQTKNLVHQPFEIARLFIENNSDQESDYQNYIY
mgnify:CR=1 FL=1